MRDLEPTLTAGLFRELSDELVSLLRSLDAPDWQRPTLAGAWRVRDVAAHLLDGDLRKLSFHRDAHTPPAPAAPITDERDLALWLDALNRQWVETAGRLGPRVLTQLLALSGPEIASFVESLDPQGPALFPVAWAGESASLNWMDTGREYTERWHHQQQIREATGRPGLVALRWLRPVLEISLRALPHAYRVVVADTGATLRIVIEGEAGGEWLLTREPDRWRLGESYGSEAGRVSASVTLSEDTAWRVFFKALSPAAALERVRIEGDPALGRAFVTTRAVMVAEGTGPA
jgi:uncharacterized protein (TIGR03083 family)